MGIQDITAVTRTPAHVKGVINLRGKVIPVVDLRLKFGLPEMEYGQHTCIIVVQLQGELCADGDRGGWRRRGTQPGRRRHRRYPDFGQGVATSYLLSMAKIEGSVKILLEIDPVLTSQERHGLDALVQ